MLRRLYDWTISLAERRNALWALAVVSFVESSVFPIPPDVLMIPMIIATPHRAFLIASVCTAASVLGGMLGYALGFFFYETLGAPILHFYGYTAKFAEFQAAYNDWGAWAVLMAGVTPFPFKVITILSGLTGLDFLVFSVAAVLARGARFFLVAALLWKFGPPIRSFIEQRLGLVATVFLVLLFGGFVVARYAL
ncbi:MAG TPA: YqaA family protein [Thermohalobaculum sp.]|nr:YqaA family protein [Thermohalobaculum sp.]